MSTDTVPKKAAMLENLFLKPDWNTMTNIKTTVQQ
jgi:hypothetical protein